MFNKFRKFNRFAEMVKEIGVSKSTICYYIKPVKILEKYYKLKKSSFERLFKNNKRNV